MKWKAPIRPLNHDMIHVIRYVSLQLVIVIKRLSEIQRCSRPKSVLSLTNKIVFRVRAFPKQEEKSKKLKPQLVLAGAETGGTLGNGPQIF